MSQNDIAEEELPIIEEYIKIAEEIMAKNHLVFHEENGEMMFYNHLVSLSRRIIKKSLLEEMDESMFTEISESSVALSTKICSELFIHGGCSFNRSEMFLVATHIEVNKNLPQGGN